MTTTEHADRTASAADGSIGDLRATGIMTSPVLAVTMDTPLTDVLNAMLRTGHRHLMVVGPLGQFLGILTDRDVASAWAVDASALSHVRAGQIIDRPPSVVTEVATVAEVAAVMIRDGVDAVAVRAGPDHPMGIVTGSDLVALMARTCLPGPSATTPITD